MSTSGGIAYLFKHGRAPMGATTRTRPPRSGIRSLASGGTPINAPLNYQNVPNYTYAPGINVAPRYEYDANGKLVYVPGKYASGAYEVAKPVQAPAGAGAGAATAPAESPSPRGEDPYSGGGNFNVTDLMNGPVGIAIGRVANAYDRAFGAKRDPSAVPVEDRVPVPVDAIRDSVIAQQVADSFGTPLGNTGNTGAGIAVGDATDRDLADQRADAAARDAAVAEGARDVSPGVGEARGGLNLHGRYFPHMATGGIAALAQGGSPQGPRLLSGGGDGLSDDIPAVIGQDQPARLADGEFVISADVVSALGGGSTKAGAKKLYAMMDRIRQGAHGTKKQVKPVNPSKVLPA